LSSGLAPGIKELRVKEDELSSTRVVEEEKMTKKETKLYYNLAGPPEERKKETVGVLPTDPPSGAGVSTGRTFELVFNLTI
jgi:hypothetical protein